MTALEITRSSSLSVRISAKVLSIVEIELILGLLRLVSWSWMFSWNETRTCLCFAEMVWMLKKNSTKPKRVEIQHRQEESLQRKCYFPTIWRTERWHPSESICTWQSYCLDLGVFNQITNFLVDFSGETIKVESTKKLSVKFFWAMNIRRGKGGRSCDLEKIQSGERQLNSLIQGILDYRSKIWLKIKPSESAPARIIKNDKIFDFHRLGWWLKSLSVILSGLLPMSPVIFNEIFRIRSSISLKLSLDSLKISCK